LSTPCLDALVGAEGSWIEDTNGRRYLDFHGNNLHHVGYGHSKIVEAIKSQLDQLPFCPRRFTNRQAVELAEQVLSRSLDLGLSFKTAMGNLLTLTPPLTVTLEELDSALDIVDKALTELDA
jgi:4-aminobutyrate aminotransferase